MYDFDICYNDKTAYKRANILPRVGDHIEITIGDQRLLSPENDDLLIPHTLVVTKVVLLLDNDLETTDALVFVDLPDTD